MLDVNHVLVNLHDNQRFVDELKILDLVFAWSLVGKFVIDLLIGVKFIICLIKSTV